MPEPRGVEPMGLLVLVAAVEGLADTTGAAVMAGCTSGAATIDTPKCLLIL